MQATQLRAFDPSKAGTKAGFCLQNVRLGYGIPALYDTAWDAWGHTQQHPDHNLPAGVAVPCYYAYTASISGVTMNYGHINVRLPDSRVWSDGVYYDSLLVYEINHPKVGFVGWGESVNGVKVLEIINQTQGGTMFENDDQIRAAYYMLRGNAPVSAAEIAGWRGKPVVQFITNQYAKKEIDNREAHHSQVESVAATVPGLQARIAQLESQPSVQSATPKQIAAEKALDAIKEAWRL